MTAAERQLMHDMARPPLCRAISSNGHIVDVEIHRTDEGKWTLQVVDRLGNVTGWLQEFESDEQALNEVYRTILEEGVAALVGPASSFLR